MKKICLKFTVSVFIKKAQGCYSVTRTIGLATVFLMALHNNLLLASSPQRIASLSLASDEILVALMPHCGGLVRVVALSTFADNASTSSITKDAKVVKGRVHSEPESLFSLNPDLVIAASFNRPELLKMVTARKIPLLTLKRFSSANDIAQHIIEIGDRIGCSAASSKLRDDFMRRIVMTNPPAQRARVILYNADLTVMGKDTLFDDLVNRAGALNVASERGLKHWPKIDGDTLLASKPEKIIVFGDDSEAARKAIRMHPAWSKLDAVRNDQFIFLESKTAQSTSHYFADAVESLRQKLK
jgi:iron complex transport system substrate-binding protein